MAFLPISPLSPELTLAKPAGSAETRLGPIPNVSDGLPGLAGIGRVEMPGIGVLSPGSGLGVPSLPHLAGPAPAATAAPGPSPIALPAPEVTPFPSATARATATPVPQITPAPMTTASPQVTSMPVPGAAQLQAPAQGSPYSTPAITSDQIPSLVQTPFAPTTTAPVAVKQTPLAETFGKYLKDAASNYNDVQAQADSMIQHLAVGDKVDIHDVALAVQKAAITNQLAIQVRNRLVEAYQEVMRMPI
jgi:flagellar hook-basal body complex protein FliE